MIATKTPLPMPLPCLGGRKLYAAPGGNDANDGLSLATAFATLQRGAEALQPGDTLLVAPGNYAGICTRAEFFHGEPSGNDGGWKCVAALDPQNKPVIDRDAGLCSRRSGILIEGTETKYVTHWVLDGLVVVDQNNWGIDMVYTSHMIVRNCEAYRNGYNGGGRAATGIFAAFSDWYVCENNISCGNFEHGFYYNNSADNFVFRGNVSRDNAGCGFHLNADYDMQPGKGIHRNGLYEHNLAADNGAGKNGKHGGGAQYNFSGLHGGIVRYNTAMAGHASGMTFYQGNSFDTSRNVEVYGNTIVQSGLPEYRNCLLFQVDAGDYDGEVGRRHNTYTGTPVNLRFWNNVFACLNPSEGYRIVENGWDDGAVTPGSSVVFEDNIFGAPGFDEGFSGLWSDEMRAEIIAKNRFVANLGEIFSLK